VRQTCSVTPHVAQTLMSAAPRFISAFPALALAARRTPISPWVLALQLGCKCGLSRLASYTFRYRVLLWLTAGRRSGAFSGGRSTEF
jgi:hypothetical protein